MSAASTCQPPPSVPASPSVHAPFAPRSCAASGVDKPAATVNIEIMDRRTFVLLTGGVSSGLLQPHSTARDRPRPPGVAGTGRLRFELDDRRRWSLWYYGDGQPVPVIRGAEIVAWVGDRPLTLAELEDSTVGNRRPPGGEAVVVRGRAAGVWVETELLVAGDTGAGGGAPQAAITVTVFPDRYL